MKTTFYAALFDFCCPCSQTVSGRMAGGVRGVLPPPRPALPTPGKRRRTAAAQRLRTVLRSAGWRVTTR